MSSAWSSAGRSTGDGRRAGARPEELDGVDDAGDRIPGKHQNGVPSSHAERDRVARLQGDPVDEHLANLADDLREQVTLADRGPAGRHDEVEVKVVTDGRPECVHVVGDDVAVGRVAAPALDVLGDGLAIRLDYLPRFWVILDLLLDGGMTLTWVARTPRPSRCRPLQQTEVRTVGSVAILVQRLPLIHVLADRGDVLHVSDRIEHCDAVAGSSVSSTITTASAPSGSSLPVWTRAAVPVVTASSTGAMPATAGSR